MNFVNRARLLAASAAAASMMALAFPASAQDISDSHLKAARAAISSIHATDQYDDILPASAVALKTELIQKNPDMQAIIGKTVDEETLKLVGRRADLEREAALAYAKVFSEEDLKGIAAFYTSPAGQKLLENGPSVSQKLIEAAGIWQRGVSRDLAQAVGEKLNVIMGSQAKPAPEGDAAPADAPADKPAQ